MAIVNDSYVLNTTIPYDPNMKALTVMGKYLTPDEFEGWRPETLSWKKSAYIGTFLSGMMPELVLKGKDARRLLEENAINGFSKMKPGSCKHVVFCSEQGNIIVHGALLCLAEDEFHGYGLQPLLPMLANSGRYDVEHMDQHPMESYIYQIGGPKSLEILEQACEEDLHDIRFMRFREASIAGHSVRILRMGMAGTLSYEVHGSADGCHEVYNRIYEIGKPLGMQKLGKIAYNICNHTENGFPQGNLHFLTAWAEHKELMEMMSSYSSAAVDPTQTPLFGSYPKTPSDSYMNPIELNWGHLINWEHDFVGKEALKKINESKHRVTVTLKWNKEDIEDILTSCLGEGPYYREMRFPHNMKGKEGFGGDQDRVEDEQGNLIGVSAGRIYTEYYHEMISMAFVEPEYAEEGKEAYVIWGNQDGPQKKARVIVARYPYLDLTANKEFDIESIPRYQKRG